MASLPLSFTMTVLASSFPGMCAAAATSCAVYAAEWLIVTYFTSKPSRNSLSCWSGITLLLSDTGAQGAPRRASRVSRAYGCSANGLPYRLVGRSASTNFQSGQFSARS